MNDPNQFGYQEELPLQGAPSPGVPANPAQHKFSAEELRVLGECNRESFFQRSLPLGTAFGLAAYAAVQSGQLKRNARFGAVPKLTVAVIAGYFLGKLSYQQACAEKLMALPGSYIGQLLRDRRDGKITPVPKQSSSMLGAGPADIYSDAGPGSSLDLDTDRPLFNEDSYHPDTQSRAPEAGGPSTAQPVASYDELRQRNRGDHQQARQDPYRLEPGGMPPISRAPPAAPARAPPRPPTNKYGDSME